MTFLQTVGVCSALALGVSPAVAGLAGPVIEIEAENANGSGSLVVDFQPPVVDPLSDSVDWLLPEDIKIRNSDTQEVMGTIKASGTSMAMLASGGPVVVLRFAITSGGLETDFKITSELMEFGQINPAQGWSSVGLTVTDGDGNGAFMGGLNAGGGIFATAYNGGFDGGGTTFAEFLPGGGPLDPFGTVAVSDATDGWLDIGGPVWDMQSQFYFSLTANDMASGTSTFVIVPGPTSLLAMGAGLLLSRRRRRAVSSA
jgi:hypothetical protein